MKDSKKRVNFQSLIHAITSIVFFTTADTRKSFFLQRMNVLGSFFWKKKSFYYLSKNFFPSVRKYFYENGDFDLIVNQEYKRKVSQKFDKTNLKNHQNIVLQRSNL